MHASVGGRIKMSNDCATGGGCKPSITHVIFDLDGLLLDTESLYTACTNKIISRYGKTFDWSIKSRMMGRKPLEAAKVLVDALQLPMTPEEFNTELYSTLSTEFPNAKLMPGAAALVRHLHAQGVPLAVATGSARGAFLIKISKYPDLFSCFHHTVCSDDKEVVHGKPSPDIYFTTVGRFEPPPKSNANVLVFEDAPNGVLAAKAAGMNCIMVPDKRTDPEKCKPADRVLGSLEDLDLAEWGLEPLV